MYLPSQITKIKQIKVALFLFSFILSSSYLKADYGNQSLCEIVARSEFGAIGHIVKIDENHFYIKVETYILGDLPFDTLKIKKFKDWSCGKRYSNYELGQKEAVFFSKSNNVISENEFIGYGGGGEFELPIKADSIYFNYTNNKLIPFALTDFLKALSDFLTFRHKFDIDKLENYKINKFRLKSCLHDKFAECYMK